MPGAMARHGDGVMANTACFRHRDNRIFVGWRGSIARMTGFFDLSGSVKYLLFGIVSGMLLASAADTMMLAGIITEQVNIVAAHHTLC